MSKIFIPADSMDYWKLAIFGADEREQKRQAARLLAEVPRPKNWKKNHSAMLLARTWLGSRGRFPGSVMRAFEKSSFSVFHSAELLFGLAEYKVPLPPYNRPASQTDLLIIAKGAGGLATIAVEGKVEEDFDELVCEKMKNASKGRKDRLSFLCHQLCLQEDQVLQTRYQLLHRTVSALLMAGKLGAKNALMLVHSFSDKNEHFDDYSAFAALFGIEAHPDRVYFAKELNGVNLYLGWVRGDRRHLTMEP